MCVGNRTENQREEYVAPWSNVVDLFILPAFFHCFLVSLVSFCYCACIYFFLQLPQKVVTSYVLVFLRVMKDLPESATVAYFCLLLGLFFPFCLCLKRRGYLDCLSLAVGGAPAAGVFDVVEFPERCSRVGMWYNLMTKACVLKVAKQPYTSLWSHPEWSCFAAHTPSVQQLFPFAQRRHFWIAQSLCAVCKVLASIRTATQGHCALGMILGSFLVVFIVMTFVFCHTPSWAEP